MNKLKRVQNLVDNLYTEKPLSELMLERQCRLKELAIKHGTECTALAAGLTLSTLIQYLRVKNPSTIGEQAVLQAEYILRKL